MLLFGQTHSNIRFQMVRNGLLLVRPNGIVSRCMVPWLPENLVVLPHPPEAFLH